MPFIPDNIINAAAFPCPDGGMAERPARFSEI